MLISRGDRRTLRAIVEAVRSGCRFDSWREHFDYAAWLDAFSAANVAVDPNLYANMGAALPWDLIDGGTDKALLIAEHERAMALKGATDAV
jgi:hypothetical protein